MFRPYGVIIRPSLWTSLFKKLHTILGSQTMFTNISMNWFSSNNLMEVKTYVLKANYLKVNKHNIKTCRTRHVNSYRVVCGILCLLWLQCGILSLVVLAQGIIQGNNVLMLSTISCEITNICDGNTKLERNTCNYCIPIRTPQRLLVLHHITYCLVTGETTHFPLRTLFSVRTHVLYNQNTQ